MGVDLLRSLRAECYGLNMLTAGSLLEEITKVQKSVEADSPRAPIAKAKWTNAQINDLPDASFLHIESGGKKDDDGKTAPRSLRHFPVKDKSGNVDLPHLRNAIARIPQSGLSADLKTKLQAKARSMLDAASKSETEKSEIVKSDESRESFSILCAARNVIEATMLMVDSERDLSELSKRTIEHAVSMLDAVSKGEIEKAVPIATEKADAWPGDLNSPGFLDNRVGSPAPKLRF